MPASAASIARAGRCRGGGNRHFCAFPAAEESALDLPVDFFVVLAGLLLGLSLALLFLDYLLRGPNRDFALKPLEVLSVECEHAIRACRFRGGNNGCIMGLLAANAVFGHELLPHGMNGWRVGRKQKKTFTPLPQQRRGFVGSHSEAVFRARTSGNRPEFPFDLRANEKVGASLKSNPERLAGFFILRVVTSGETTEDV